MSKTIKLEAETYQDLDKLRRKGETFSQAVSRLLRVYQFLERMLFLFKSQETPAAALAASHRGPKPHTMAQGEKLSPGQES